MFPVVFGLCIICNCTAMRLTPWCRYTKGHFMQKCRVEFCPVRKQPLQGRCLGKQALSWLTEFSSVVHFDFSRTRYAYIWWAGMSFRPCLRGLACWDLGHISSGFYWHIGRSVSASRASEIPPDVNSLFGQDVTSLYSRFKDAMQTVCLDLFWPPLKASCSL